MSRDPITVRHKRLLTDISDFMVNGSAEYFNFVEHMKGYVPRGLLQSKKTLLGKFDALASKGHLKPGKYNVLKKIATDSGNIDIVNMIEAAEKDNYLDLVKQGDLELDRHAIRHRLLLTNIADMFDTGSPEYMNFVEHMRSYVPRGLLASRKTLLGQFDALSSKGHLALGKYDVLKKISHDSGNMDIVELIEQAETDMQKLKATEKETAFASPLSEIRDELSNAIIKVAEQKARKVGIFESPKFEDVESIVEHTQTALKDFQDDESDDVGKHPEVNQLFTELREQKYLSVDTAPLPEDDDDSGIIGSFSQASSGGVKRTFTSAFSSEDTDAMMFGYSVKLSKHDISPTPKLLSQEKLNSMWAQSRGLGKDKTKIFDICNNICNYIKSRYSGSLLDVWPAYDSSNLDKVLFVLTTKDGSDDTKFDLEYATLIKPVNSYSQEASLVMKSKEISDYELSFEESEKIKNAINRRAKELMKNHRNLSAISGNGLRSKGFNQGKHELIKEPCIVLYVQTKGKIPLDETEFPKFLEGLPVDVREGEFQNCALATEYQETLHMGCQIKSGKQGTLGGFVDHPEYGLCAVTCAHVVLSDAEIHDLQRDGKKKWNNNEKQAFQPDEKDQVRNLFGHVKEASYKSGGNGKSGVDLAIIQIERRPPDSGNFPDVNNAPEDMVFESGQSCSSLNENNNSVIKFGRTTNKTEGFVQFSKAVVRLIEHTKRYTIQSGDFSYRLFDMFEIRPCSTTASFAERGDSGSLVFKKDVSGDLLCVGMVVGVLQPCGNGIVIPISAVLSELGVRNFKDFRWKRLDRIEKRLENIDKNLMEIIRNQRP